MPDSDDRQLWGKFSLPEGGGTYRIIGKWGTWKQTESDIGTKYGNIVDSSD